MMNHGTLNKHVSVHRRVIYLYFLFFFTFFFCLSISGKSSCEYVIVLCCFTGNCKTIQSTDASEKHGREEFEEEIKVSTFPGDHSVIKLCMENLSLSLSLSLHFLVLG
ncbi:hypothetical protein Ddye_006632 [Dipteronia dyeriana]|uniref:Uncharacterized protein n=1 Tax=Dipteronia dyeriana TaxID=168575 RepID=A0AAE0CQV9_9ROSI|nr:hypothetical protein Ddye_006632 [Dipteronia dyeriana]